MLTVHHLGKSQSERVVWLCEELGIPYELKVYDRGGVSTRAAPLYSRKSARIIRLLAQDGGNEIAR